MRKEKRVKKHLMEKLSSRSEEEQIFLKNLERDVIRHSKNPDFTIRDSRVRRGKSDITMRIHSSFEPFPAHKHNFVEMMTVVSGSISHRIGNNDIELKLGDILLMNKHITHSIGATSDNDIGINFILSDAFLGAIAPSLTDTVFGEFLKENSKSDGEAMYLHLSTAGHKQIENLLENLMFELAEEEYDHTVLQETISLLLRYLSLGRESLLCGGGVKFDKSSGRKMEIIAYINGNYRSANLADLARKLYVSTPHLSKTISELFGQSFKELVVSERMRRAVELITKTDMPIGAIIRSVGYENESYFHREFKRREGITPLEKRKLAKASLASVSASPIPQK